MKIRTANAKGEGFISAIGGQKECIIVFAETITEGIELSRALASLSQKDKERFRKAEKRND